MITLEIDIDSVINKLPKSMTSNANLNYAIAKSLNHASRTLKNDTIRTLRDDLGFPAKRTKNSQFKLVKATELNLEVILRVSGSPVPLNEFKGVTINSKYIKTKYTDKFIKPSGDYKYFKLTDWSKIQSDYNTRFSNNSNIVKRKDGLPLNFLRKKNSNRVTIQQVSDTFMTAKSQSSALYDATTNKRREMDEVFGISPATGITMTKFGDDFIDTETKLQNDFENKLVELLTN